MSYDVNHAPGQDKAPDFPRYADGLNSESANNLVDNTNANSLESSSFVPATERKASRRQAAMNHELQPRPQLKPINSLSTIGKDDSPPKDRQSQQLKGPHYQVMPQRNDSVDPQVQGQIRNIAQILQNRFNQRSNLMPQRNISQISDMGGNKNLNEEQAANLRRFVNQQKHKKMRQQQRAAYLGNSKKGGALAAAVQNGLQRSSLAKVTTESNSLSNSLSS